MNEKSVVGWALPTKAEKCVSSSKESISLVILVQALSNAAYIYPS